MGIFLGRGLSLFCRFKGLHLIERLVFLFNLFLLLKKMCSEHAPPQNAHVLAISKHVLSFWGLHHMLYFCCVFSPLSHYQYARMRRMRMRISVLMGRALVG